MKTPVSKQQCVRGTRIRLRYELEGLGKNDNLPVLASQAAGSRTSHTVLIPVQLSVQEEHKQGSWSLADHLLPVSICWEMEAHRRTFGSILDMPSSSCQN